MFVSVVLGVTTQPRQWDAFRRHLRLLVLHGVEHSLGKRVSFLCVVFWLLFFFISLLLYPLVNSGSFEPYLV